MLYLSGHVPTVARSDAAREAGVGVLLTPIGCTATPPEGYPWCADSGCFNRKTYVGDAGYLSWLASMPPEACLFATVPDVVGDHDATLALWPDLSRQIRKLGYPVAFVAQDGATPATVPWGELDALFVGGSTKWKLSEDAYALIAAAKLAGKWVHVGRVNSRRRLLAMAAAGADSCDGTYIAFGPDQNLPDVIGWLDHHHRTPTLLDHATR